MDRPVLACLREMTEHRCQKIAKLGFAHLPRRHCKFGVRHATQPANMAVHRHIIGRVRKDHLGMLAGKQPGIDSRIARIATNQAMLAENPEVAAA